MTDADTLRERFREIDDPLNGEDIVTMDLVDEISVREGVAHITLAFNTPFAAAEIDIGEQIRAIVEDVGLDPHVEAAVGTEHGFDEEVLPDVRNVIAVASGKGGVGKTTVAANLAAGLAKLGATVGVLDADIHGPNVPRAFNVSEEPGVDPVTDSLVPPEAHGVKVMSMAFMLADPDDPAIMRGPIVQKVMTHFLENVNWGQLDYLIVDLPPGTGDASLDLLQTLPVAGTVIVTTPQRMALDDARKGIRLFEKHDAPIVGIVENMSTFQCPHCGESHDLYGGRGAVEICEDFGVPHLGSIPTHPDFGTEGAPGPVVQMEDSPVQESTMRIVTTALDTLGALNRQRVANPSALPEVSVDVTS